MKISKYCPFQKETVPCTPMCALYNENVNFCDISRIAVALYDIADELSCINGDTYKLEDNAHE